MYLVLLVSKCLHRLRSLFSACKSLFLTLILRNPLHNLYGLKKIDSDVSAPRFIVTLTTYDKRILKIAPYAIASIFRQSILPDKVILWLAHGVELPPIYNKLKIKWKTT